MRTRCVAMFFAVLFVAATASAGVFSLHWTTDKQPVSYLPGDRMTFKIQLVEDGKPMADKILKWRRTGDDQKTAEGQGVSSETGRPLVRQRNRRKSSHRSTSRASCVLKSRFSTRMGLR